MYDPKSGVYHPQLDQVQLAQLEVAVSTVRTSTHRPHVVLTEMVRLFVQPAPLIPLRTPALDAFQWSRRLVRHRRPSMRG